MNLINTKVISVSGVYETQLTFGKLLMEAIIEELVNYGFTVRDSGNDSKTIGWNGKDFLFLQPKESATNAAIRIATPYGTKSNNWGSTYSFSSISSSSTEEQTVSVTMRYFASGDVTYLYIIQGAEYNSFTMMCETPEGVASKIHIGVSNNSIIPILPESMDNNWYLAKYEPPCKLEDLARCYVALGVGVYNSSNNICQYFCKDLAIVNTKATLDVGQVCTIDGVRYIYFGKSYFVKIPNE